MMSWYELEFGNPNSEHATCYINDAPEWLSGRHNISSQCHNSPALSNAYLLVRKSYIFSMCAEIKPTDTYKANIAAGKTRYKWKTEDNFTL